MNADVLLKCNVSPRSAKIGTELILPEDAEGCPWRDGPKIIKAGTYIVVNRKYFNGGCLTVEPKI